MDDADHENLLEKIKRWEAGIGEPPSWTELRLLGEALGVPPDDLLLDPAVFLQRHGKNPRNDDSPDVADLGERVRARALSDYQAEATRLRRGFGPIRNATESAQFAGVLFECWQRYGCPRTAEADRMEAEMMEAFGNDPDPEMVRDALVTMVPMAAAWPERTANLRARVPDGNDGR